MITLSRRPPTALGSQACAPGMPNVTQRPGRHRIARNPSVTRDDPVPGRSALLRGVRYAILFSVPCWLILSLALLLVL